MYVWLYVCTISILSSGCRDDWLNLSIDAGKVPKRGEVAEIVISNDHTATTLRYIVYFMYLCMYVCTAKVFMYLHF